MIFDNREKAGKALAEELKKRGETADIVLALPRGGVAVAREVAKELNAPMDLILVRKIGAPFNEELALGAIVEGTPPHTYMNEDLVNVLKVNPSHIEQEKFKQFEEIKRQQKNYRDGQARQSVEGKKVIIVDDGIATGASVHAALVGLQSEKPARLTLAIPVASPDVVKELRDDVDELVCLHTPADFQAVGQFYRNFHQVSNDEVKRLLKS